MRVEAVELRQLEIPMIEPMAAAYGSVSHRQTILIQVITDQGTGWGECVALNEPLYSPDWSNGEWYVLKEVLIPTLLRADQVDAETVAGLLAPYKQHHTSKAAIEMAVLDAQLKAEGRSLAEFFDADHAAIHCSYVVGLLDNEELLHRVSRALNLGYRAVKLKIKPGMDLARIDMLLKEFPDMPLRVDANASYAWNDPEHRRALMEIDTRGLAMIEQPLPPDEVLASRDLAEMMVTPIALDETLTSFTRAKSALETKACDALVIKPGMLGGYLVARQTRAEAARWNIPTMVGGMVETAIARAANLALAAAGADPVYPAEVSPDGRWFDQRLNVEPVEMINGTIEVPKSPGVIGELDWPVMASLTNRVHLARRS